jgi:hypothetical protein
MCMACEQEFMYQAYLNYLASKAAQEGVELTPEEKAFLEASGFVSDPAPEATGFACDPVSEAGADEPGSPFSRMRPKAS